MDAELLTFMPNGGITLKLVRRLGAAQPPQQIPSEDAPAEEAPALEEEEAEAADDVFFFAPDPPASEHTANVFYPPPVRGRRDSGSSSVRDRSASPPPGFWERLKKDPAAVVVPENQDVRCVVSLGHMKLASPYFQKRLSGQYADAVALREEGRVEITLSDDPDTLIILLNIIHGRTRKVPRQVSLELLTKLAVLVNYYGMLESVELFSDTWIENLKREGMPREYNDQVLPWLFISWVFEKDDDFRRMARIVQRECDEMLDELAGTIPLPQSMIDAIEKGRQIAIESAVTAINGLVTQYMDDQISCNSALDDEQRYACDAMVLGSLMKGSRGIGIWPKPVAPFHGKPLGKILEQIRSIRILDIHSDQNRGYQSSFPSWNCHGLEDLIKTTLDGIEDGLGDLKLGDYKKNNEELWDDFPLGSPAPVPEQTLTIPDVDVSVSDEETPKVAEWPRQNPFVAEPVPTPEIEMKSPVSQNSRREEHQAGTKTSAAARNSVIGQQEKNPRHSLYSIPRKDVNTKPVQEDDRMGRQSPAQQPPSSPENMVEPPPSYHTVQKKHEIPHASTVPYRSEPAVEPFGRLPVVVQQEAVQRSSEHLPSMQNWQDARPDSPKRSTTLEDLKAASVLDQGRHSPPSIAESPRRSPLIEEVKEVYPFEHNASEPSVEGVRVNDSWLDASALEVQKMEDGKAGLGGSDDNDLFIPPATFKVRKSKKRFATRF